MMFDIMYLFPVFFAGMFTFVLFILSRKGWVDLADKYECKGHFRGDRVGIISAGINGVSYNNCLLLKYNNEGFYIRPIFIFRLFHKPLFIPWKEIQAIRDKQIIFVKLKELVIGNPAIALLQLGGSTFLKIEKFMPRNASISAH